VKASIWRERRTHEGAAQANIKNVDRVQRMSRLAIYLLGPPRIERLRDGEAVHIGRRKALALLAYLAVTPGSRRRDTLATLLWPDYDQSSARAHLRRALVSLTKRLGSERFVADRETIGLDHTSGLWLDVHRFHQRLENSDAHAHVHTASAPCPDCLAQLTEAAELYRGEFLAGFSLPDSQPFDDWQRQQTEALRDDLGCVLERLSTLHAAQGEYKPAISAAQRWLELDPLHEAAHRRLMELFAQAGRGDAALRQYRACVRVLEQELGVPPSAETTALYERLRDERFVREERTAPARKDRVTALPAFLEEDTAPIQVERPVFVARAAELTRLDGYLETALAGQGGVAFITGGPGRGKTALVHAFTQRALEAHPDLLVAGGTCNAFSGVGDPYLPFRQVMGMLTGEVESRWAAGTLSTEHARRLWGALPAAVGALLDRGPHLIDVLVPGAALLSRARTFETLRDCESLGVLRVSELQEWLERRRITARGLEQERIFQQVADTLVALSRTHPLLLTLDDLQWTDSASASLLFHLGRQLGEAGGRILILGAYRPEEVALDRPSTSSGERERHPLQKVLREFRRHLGDVWLDLAEADDRGGQAFVEAYLDSEPNRLGAEFRAALSERTGGHPLFTVELLRGMQERGELVQDGQGVWLAGPALNWETLPDRVEAAIQERIERLDEEARDLLAVASVGGEMFTAQAVAQVQGLSERDVLQALSRELGPFGHRLVREAGEVALDDRFLSRYQFGHALFQAYLYGRLSAAERRLLHGEIGGALEELYGHRTDAIAPALAQHFEAAGDLEKAAPYSERAAELAFTAFAYGTAIEHNRTSLRLYRQLGDRAGEAQILRRLGFNYEILQDLAESVQCHQESLQIYRELGDPMGEAVTLNGLGWANIYASEYDPAETCFLEAVDIFREIGALGRQANTMHGLGRLHREHTGDFERASAYAHETLRLSREIGDVFNEAMGNMALGYTYHYQGDYIAAHLHMTAAVQLCDENGWLIASIECLPGVALNAIALGDYATALAHLERSRRIVQEIRQEGGIGDALGHSALALLYHQQGKDQTACEYARCALIIDRSAGHRYRQAFTLARLGHALTGLGQLEDADAAYQEALDLRRETGQSHLAPEPLAGLARVALLRRDLETALSHVEAILSHLETGSVDGTDEPLRIYLTCYRVLKANDDRRAQEVLEEAHNLLQERAVKIDDEALRHSFLENVAAHRELVSEWQAVNRN
jgi:DNA-binding SARP family transcriptional activator